MPLAPRIAVLATLAALAAGAAAAQARLADEAEHAAAAEAMRLYLTAREEGHHADAWAMLSEGLREAQPLARFEEAQAAARERLGALTRFNVVRVLRDEAAGDSEVAFVANYANGYLECGSYVWRDGPGGGGPGGAELRFVDRNAFTPDAIGAETAAADLQAQGCPVPADLGAGGAPEAPAP